MVTSAFEALPRGQGWAGLPLSTALPPGPGPTPLGDQAGASGLAGDDGNDKASDNAEVTDDPANPLKVFLQIP